MAADLQKTFDVAVVVVTRRRGALEGALRSIVAQEGAGRVQILVGVDGDGDRAAIERLQGELPDTIALTVIDPGYSTARGRGGLYASAEGGSLRAALTLLANARHVGYLGETSRYAPTHLADLKRAIGDRAWAWSRRWFADRASGAHDLPRRLGVGRSRPRDLPRVGGRLRGGGHAAAGQAPVQRDPHGLGERRRRGSRRRPEPVQEPEVAAERDDGRTVGDQRREPRAAPPVQARDVPRVRRAARAVHDRHARARGRDRARGRGAAGADSRTRARRSTSATCSSRCRRAAAVVLNPRKSSARRRTTSPPRPARRRAGRARTGSTRRRPAR